MSLCVFVCVCVIRLVDCLKDLGAADWQLAGQVCQALWNLLDSGSEGVLEMQERESLLQILTTYLGWFPKLTQESRWDEHAMFS